MFLVLGLVLADIGNQTVTVSLHEVGGSQVADAELTTDSSGVWKRFRSSTDFKANLVDGATYEIKIESDTGGANDIANAKIILEQHTTGEAITATEIYHQYLNSNQSHAQTGTTAYAQMSVAGGSALADSKVSSTGTSYERQWSSSISPADEVTYDTELSLDDATYTEKDFDNLYDADNFVSGTFTYYFESTLRTPSANNMDVSNSWLIIQITDLQVPEIVIFLIPVIIFLPKIVEWLIGLKKKGQTLIRV